MSRYTHGVRAGPVMARKTPASKQGGDGTGNGGTVYDPHGAARALGKAIAEALDPARAPGPIRRWADMSAVEREEMRRLYAPPPKVAP